MVATLAILVACDERTEVRWHTDKDVPPAAVSGLLSTLTPTERGAARKIAEDLLAYMVELHWDEREKELDRAGIAAEYEAVRAGLLAVPSGHRPLRLRQLAYLEGLSSLRREARRLVYRRVELDLPGVRDAAESRKTDAIAFKLAPELDDAELVSRAAVLRDDLMALQRRYRDAVTPYLECVERVRLREDEVAVMIENIAGDLTTTTGEIHQLLEAQGHATRPHSTYDRGQPGGWRAGCPPPP